MITMVSICERGFDQDAKKDKKALNWSMCGLLYEIRGFSCDFKEGVLPDRKSED